MATLMYDLMLPETLIAAILGACLFIFYLVNIFNLRRNRRRRKALHAPAEPKPEALKPPKNLATGLAAFGTLVFWFGSILYVIFVFMGILPLLDNILHPMRFKLDSYVQGLGVIMTLFGYFVFTWSVITRGRYATAWDMPQNHKLVMWGSYRYVRHPSYLSYFIMFFGLFLIWPAWIALVPIIAIPGYLQVANAEERMLVQRFGDEYLAYQKTVGQFFPKLRKRLKKGNKHLKRR